MTSSDSVLSAKSIKGYLWPRGAHEYLPQVTNAGDLAFGFLLLDCIRTLTSKQFEGLACQVLAARGLDGVRLTGGSGDRGIDGQAKIPALNLKVAFQAKHWSSGKNVGPQTVREFVGALTNNNYQGGILVTSSHFTSSAEGEAQDAPMEIALVDGFHLMLLMCDSGLGVTQEWVAQKGHIHKDDIDEAFFLNLAK